MNFECKPLTGLKVLEFNGWVPGTFCGKILIDFGAEVTIISQVPDKLYDPCSGGKRLLTINLKKPLGQRLIRELTKTHDVIIDPYRPGVMEKFNLGPDILCKENPRLIYARLTAFGQTGRLASRGSYELNVLSLSGVLSMMGRGHDKPMAPDNILCDAAGGSLMCAFGICLAIVERNRSGQGQVIDAAMMDGAAYLASWLFMTENKDLFMKSLAGDKMFDGNPYYYDTFECKDGKFMSVGPIEARFFEAFKKRLHLPQLVQFAKDKGEMKYFKALITATFLEKTQAEWSAIFEEVDACVYPVLEWQNVMQYEHISERESFQLLDGHIVPNPAPRLNRTPGMLSTRSKTSAEAIEEALNLVRNLNLSQMEFSQLIEDGVLTLPVNAKL